MPLKLPAALLDVTRLVRQGHLTAATHAIQRALRNDKPSHADRSVHLPPNGELIDGDFQVVEESRREQKPGRFITRRYTNAAGTREYRLYIPGAAHPGPLPVIVMLHGCKQGPDDFAAATRMNALAEEEGFIVVYPKQAAKANQSKCWNWFEAAHQQRDAGEPSLIAGITREVVAEQRADAQRVYIAGLSAGGAMAAVMAAMYPDVYAAVGVHSGLAYEAAHDVTSAFSAMHGMRSMKATGTGARPPRSVPTIVFHGDSDDTVHPRNAEDVIAQASAATTPLEATVEQGQANGRSYTRTTYRNAQKKSVIEQWLVHGAAHAWFGGSDEGSFADTRGPDASREMLRFFLLHRNQGH